MSSISVINSLKAQTYKRGDTTLSVFAINDTLKYFEFYTPEYPHGDVEVGILSKKDKDTYTLKYVEGANYAPFDLLFQGDSVFAIKLSEKGYMAFVLEKGSFLKVNASPSQAISQFHLNYPIFYKAKNKVELKVYEYPAFESKTKKMLFNKGSKIEQKWGVGLYNKHKSIKDKTWIAAVRGSKFIGWLLLSEVGASFEKTEQ